MLEKLSYDHPKAAQPQICQVWLGTQLADRCTRITLRDGVTPALQVN